MSQLSSHALRCLRANTRASSAATHQQIRYASLLKRPQRPYTFTQLITLSDGSTYTQRSTSPQPVFKSTKDTRNHPLWNPSLDSLRNVEEDEAGRLRAFRERFGRGWDVEGAQEEEAKKAAKKGKDAEADKQEAERRMESQEESLMDLISGQYAATQAPTTGKKGKK